MRVVLISAVLAAALVRDGIAEPLSPRAIERYKQVLAANPVEGTVLDRLWNAYVEAGKTAELVAEYKAGENFSAKMVLGHLLRRIGQFDGALSAFATAAELDKRSPLPLLALAAVHDTASRPREAAESLGKALVLIPPDDPSRGEILMRLGEKWLAAGDLQKATEAWEETVRRDPDNSELRSRLAETYAQHQLGERAVPHLEYVAGHASPSERAFALQRLARIHEGADRPDEAITALEKGIALTAQGNWLRAELQSQLIRLHQRHHRLLELEARWKQRAAEQPRDAGILLQLVDLLEQAGDLEQERLWLEKLVTLLPKNVDYRLRLARLLVRLDQTDAAVPLYDKLLGQLPANPDLVFERAHLDIERNVPTIARQRIAALLAARKSDEMVRARALDFFEKNRLHDAVEEHLKADATNGNDEALLALARFYFAQRRDGDAQRTLERTIRAEAPPAQRAASHLRVAEVLKSQGDLAGAISAVNAAISLISSQTDARENYLLLGELETARGDHLAAQAAFEKAFALSTTPSEAIDADQKLFDSLRNQTSRQDPKRVEARGLSSGRPDEGQTISTAALQSALLSLTRAAASKQSVDAWLRVARWHLWSRNPRVAQECAQQALTIDSRSVAANEFMVKLAVVDPQPQRAIYYLRELEKIDPNGKSGYERRIAQIELQSAHMDEALRIFSELADAAPGNVDALNDLTMAQERADRWSDALGTCRRMLALSSGARKKDAVVQLQRIYERLRMPVEAATLLLEQIDAQTEEKERFNLFHDLLAHCTKHEQLDWLREQLQSRRKLRADDYFLTVALGRTLKSAGEKAAAFDLFAVAALAAPNPADALPELVREAEELRKLDAAVHLQEQLVKMLPQAPAETHEKLAQLQERNFDITAAAQTWARITTKFPRDATILQHAADFELKWGTPARALEVLRKTRELEPANLRTLATLAELELDSGKSSEAAKWFEEILRLAPSEKSGAIRFPAWKPEDPGRLQSTYLDTVRLRRGRPNSEAMRALRSFWVTDQPGVKNDSDLRLNAIRQLATLVRAKGDASALERWTERWRKTAADSSEALWAFYYSGAHTALLDHLETLMARPESEAQSKQAFLWLALQTHEFDRLGTWLRDKRRTAADRDFLLVAIGQHLNASGGAVDPTMIERLFPPGFRLRLWQAAQMFANRGQFAEAVQLGRRVFEALSTQRAGYGIDLATWCLYLGDVDAARAILRASIDKRGETFEAPVYAALRQYWLLLPETERSGFSDTFLASLDEEKEPLHAAICSSLLHGLAGREQLAREQLRPRSRLRCDVAPFLRRTGQLRFASVGIHPQCRCATSGVEAR
jgi:tetratricopeptide (TPR) repeat protein